MRVLQDCLLDQLAARAEMGAALSHDDAFDRGVAVNTCHTCALIDPELILKITPAIHPVDAGAITSDTFTQYFPYRAEQLPSLVKRESTGFLQRVDARLVQRLVGINVSQPADKTLVHQQRFDGGPASLQ